MSNISEIPQPQLTWPAWQVPVTEKPRIESVQPPPFCFRMWMSPRAGGREGWEGQRGTQIWLADNSFWNIKFSHSEVFHLIAFMLSSFHPGLLPRAMRWRANATCKSSINFSFIFLDFFHFCLWDQEKENLLYITPMSHLFSWWGFPFPSTLSLNRFFPPLCSYISLENTNWIKGEIARKTWSWVWTMIKLPCNNQRTM